MAIIRPRLTDYYNLLVAQEDIDFAIPFLDEDIPFYVDPFLLWKSPSQQDNALHLSLINAFNYLGYLVNKKKEIQAIDILIRISECEEAGLDLFNYSSGSLFTESSITCINYETKEITKIR